MSAKTSNQQGRRTPLSLSGGVPKGQQSNNNKGGGNSANGHNTNNIKQDNKHQQNQQQKTEQTNVQKQQQQQTDSVKENPSKAQNKQQNADSGKSQKHQNQNDHQKKSSEKQQNGVTQQNSKDKQQNGNDVKLHEKDKKLSATQEQHEVEEDREKNKAEEKSEKEDKKSKDDNKKEQELKKEEKKAKDYKKGNDNKKESKSETSDSKRSIVALTETKTSSDDSSKEQEDVVEIMEVALDEPKEEKQDTPKSAPGTPKSIKEIKTTTPSKSTITVVEKTPTKDSERTDQKSTPKIREVTTAIDDVEMEPLTVEQSPSKVQPAGVSVVGGLAPSATSTPGKIVLPKRNVPIAKTDVQLAMQSSSTPERIRAFSQISGRRAIRPSTDYTPSKFQSNPQFRESYRRINTELDATNTSLNVTVGSEVPNNSSFSFFGRGRKRDRTPPKHSQSAIGELPIEMETSPPKRARLDFFSVVSSPLTLLRNRFSKTTLQSSTPVKLQQKLDENEDDIEVQNVSGVSVHEDIEKPEGEREYTDEDDTTLGVEAATDNTPIDGELEIGDNGDKEIPSKSDKQMFEDGDIKITETPLQYASADTVAKNKRCVVM